MSNPSNLVRGLIINLYRSQWVLTSATQVAGGQTLDAPPVRVVGHAERDKLLTIITELLAERIPLVGQPDWNDPRNGMGIRAPAVGAASWLAFVRESRCFNLEQHPNQLILEEWPREGGSFTANASWRRKFPDAEVAKLVNYLIRKTRHPKKYPSAHHRTRKRE